MNDKKCTEDRWYFAYGSNLSREQKESRTGPVRMAIRCQLHGYRLAFNKRGKNGEVFANIERSKGSDVWGVAYLCDETTLQEMDRHEIGYQRALVRVVSDRADELEAVTYVAASDFVCDEGNPSSAYLCRILAGARLHGLPVSYIRSLENRQRRP
jgi:gamma-glutamylcyclotransferase (GGCT)/AIG2-like uncharacterized protein YtfP